MTPAPVLPDADARARIQGDLDATLVVEAAAGTGKTTQLIRRMVAVLRSGRTALERIVAVTFTEKAAGEMKLRLRAELDAALRAADADERAHLERALSELELAHINTIHGFCADLLRERPIEAGVDPAFEVLDDAAADRLLEQAFDDWFEQELSAPPEGVRRALRRASWRAERSSPREQLLNACRELCEHRDFTAPYRVPEYDRKACIDAVVAGLQGLGALAARCEGSRDKLAQALRFFARWSAELAARERTRPRDYDGVEADLRAMQNRYEWKWRGGSSALAGLPRDTLLEQREQVHAALCAFLTLAEAELAALLQRELSVVVAAREALKRKAGVLDFLDLLLCTRDLLANDLAVRAELQRRFTHLFVDEFQDTDPLQAEILFLLAADPEQPAEPSPAASFAAERAPALRLVPGKLFAVGDPKQSIYRFRRADVSLYERLKQRLCAGGAQLLHLTTSFRSLPQIQTAVNAAFAQLMTGADDGSQAEYVALAPSRPAVREQPAVIALPVPEPYGGNGQLTKKAVDASYPHAVAAFVDWLLRHSGWTVDEGGARVPIKARHVCLLFRRFQAFGEDKTRGVVRALEARRIPHVLVGGRSLHGREETIALRAALTAIEWPDDELHVYATLRGPFFAISDDELLRFLHDLAPERGAASDMPARARLHPLRAFSPEQAAAHPAVIDALSLLRRLHRGRNRRPIADTLARLLEHTRAHAGIAIWPTGEQALANVLAMIDAARAFETRGALSFRGFVDWLEHKAERGDGSEATIVEEGTDGVRLMTIHKAKGLEFPVVVLCDPTAPLAPNAASRVAEVERGLWAQRLCGCRPQELIEREAEVLRHDEAENVRLAYVAATRARDLLVVPAFGDARGGKPNLGWVDVLAPALYPQDAARRSPRPAPGCPPFGADTVLRTQYAAAPAGSAIQPGLHEGFAGGTEAVFWDPALLALDAQAIGGVRQQHLLAQTERSNEWIDAYAAFRAQREQQIAAASVPSLPVRSVTQLSAQRAEAALAAAPPAEARTIPIERTLAERAGRPRGPRFGALVHATLAIVPLDADAALIAALAGLQQRILAATDAERAAAVTAVAAALAHPLMQRAARALECRREVPVMHRLPDGSIARGVADLVFREPAAWVVVDFKTDAELEAGGRYAEQVLLYMDAVQAATAAAVSGVLLSV